MAAAFKALRLSPLRSLSRGALDIERFTVEGNGCIKPSVLSYFPDLCASRLAPVMKNFQRITIATGLLLCTVAVTSIAYYYVIALPKHNAARLRFEQDKYNEEKLARERREVDEITDKAKKKVEEEYKKTMLEFCLDSADENSEQYILLNGGEKTARGTIEAPRWVWDEAAKQKKAAKDECYRQYQ